MAGESRLQRKIRIDLEKQGWVVVKIILCSKPGFPDQLCFRTNQVMLIEAKDKGKTAKPLQEHWHSVLRKMRFNVFVIDSWEKYLTLKQRL